MAEVTAIINARPLLPVSADPEQPFILSPSVLLTQKTGVPPPPGDFSDKDLYTKQWRVSAVFPGKDNYVRKVEVTTTDQGHIKTFLRPIAEVVLLLPKD